MKFKFNLNEIVFLKTDPDQRERIVTGLIIRPGSIVYNLSCGTEETAHYDIEITESKDWNK